MHTQALHSFMGFDIETRPLPENVDLFTTPLPGFNADDVKTGNLKDPAKIAEKIEAERAAHARAAERHLAEAHAKAALHPFTGAVCVIGLIDERGRIMLLDGAERELLARFWSIFGLPGDPSRQWLCWSGSGDTGRMFDLDFIVTRSRIHGIAVPAHVRRGRYYTDRVTDLAAEFLLHRRDAYCSITKAAELLGFYYQAHTSEAGEYLLRRKRDDDPVRGENFWKFWDGTDAERDLARAYLENDLRHLHALASRLL